MDSLLKNGTQSIQLGVEDYRSVDPRRIQSAVRNTYAGVLLLCKEVLRRLSPPGSNDILVRRRWRSVRSPWPSGAVHLEGVGRTTIDHNEIVERFKNLAIQVDLSGLHTLSEIRNDIEHFFVAKQPQIIREALAAAMPIIGAVIRELGEQPVALLGADTWGLLLDEAKVHEHEAAECRASFDGIDWDSDALATALPSFRCEKCGSSLVRQQDPANTELNRATLICTACGEKLEPEQVTEAALEDHFAVEAHVAAKDGGDAPLVECPECSRETYVVEENCCASCGFSLEGLECAVCSKSLDVDDYAAGDGNLCSYHAYVASKDD